MSKYEKKAGAEGALGFVKRLQYLLGDVSGLLALDGGGKFVSSDTVGVLLWVLFYSKAQVVVNASKGLYDGYIQHTVKQGDLWVGTGTK